MNKIEAINFIENRPWQGQSNDLSSMKILMDKLGNPQNKLKYVHIAGTNGKGSASALTTSILLKAGYKVGTFTSPHLIDYEERIKVNNISISEKDFCRVIEKIQKVSSNLEFKPKVFEILTAAAFVYFEMKKCDIVVLEVGMGGRLDATNIINESLVSLIMNIGLEHTEILGDTLSKIAYEKSGIIKQNGDAILYDNVNEVVDTVKEVCKQRNAKLVKTCVNDIKILKEGIDSQIFDYKKLKNINLSLIGKHQFYNAAVVIEAINILNKKGYKVSNKNIRDGLKNTIWDARLSILSTSPLFILDGAHNPQCANALKESLPKILKKKKAIILCGMLKDKDYNSTINMMLPFAKEFICVTPNSSRALSGEELSRIIRKKKFNASDATNIKEGIKLALSKAKGNDVVLAFGSLYLAGDVLKYFKACQKEVLREKIKEKRDRLSNKRVLENSNKVVERIKKSKEYKEAKNILIYKRMNNEVDLSVLAQDKNKTFAYPKCENNKMIPLISNEFTKGKYGILEPVRNKSKVMKKIDLVICPLVSFDEECNRLGQGKGYYDRFLSNYDGNIVGVAHEIQRVRNVPIEKHDKKLNAIYTEVKKYK